jgi:hypothetical protein
LKSIHQAISEKIAGMKAGRLVFPRDFRGDGADSAIKMSLSRFAASGKLQRLGHGIYIIPSKNKTDESLPSIEAIAKAIAKRESVRIILTGKHALYKLGLIPNEPTEWEYLTDGQPRHIMIGENALIFKAATLKKFSLKGPISSLIILGMEEIGQANLTNDHLNTIKEKLNKEDPEKVLADMEQAPAWIYNQLIKIKKVKICS